jgi:hypothetical protein
MHEGASPKNGKCSLKKHGLVEEETETQPSLPGLIIVSPATRQFLPGYFQSRLTALKCFFALTE